VADDGDHISMSMKDILSGHEGDCDKRLELFRDSEVIGESHYITAWEGGYLG
jgi:hypothetical protein